jgi:hypothetical protein
MSQSELSRFQTIFSVGMAQVEQVFRVRDGAVALAKEAL